MDENMTLGQRILWTVIDNTIPVLVLIALVRIGRYCFDAPMVQNWK